MSRSGEPSAARTSGGPAEERRLRERCPVLLFLGDRVLAEPEARRWVEERARTLGAEPLRHFGPEGLESAIADLRTASLFGGGKLHLFVETGLLASPLPPEELLAAALAGPAVTPETPALDAASREAALALLRLLRLLGVEVDRSNAVQAIEAIPESLWKANRGSRAGARRMDRAEARERLAALFELARREGLRGLGEDAVGAVTDLVRDGLPEGHQLVLVESRADPAHPLLAELDKSGAVVRVAALAPGREVARGGFRPLLERLAAETGVRLDAEAAQELVRRTVRTDASGGESLDSDSLLRLEAEYRKLAELAAGNVVGRELVVEVVADRGEEGAFEWLDALGEGRVGESLARLGRRLRASADPEGELLRAFAQLTGFVKQAALVGATARCHRVPLRPESFVRFRDRVLPRLLEPIEGVERSLLAGSKPYPLYRAFLMAARLPEPVLERLPAHLLEVETRLKGGSTEPELALFAAVAGLVVPGQAPDRSARLRAHA